MAAGAEAATGLVLMIVPPLVTRLLLGAEISGVAIALGRLGGFGLLSFGLACWPDRNAAGNFGRAFQAMLTYSLLCTVYLLYLGIRGEWVGRSLVAGSCVARRRDLLTRHGVVQDKKGGEGE